MTRLPEDIAGSSAPPPRAASTTLPTATPHGVASAWCGLANSEELVPVAKVLLELGARLSMISALQLPAARRGGGRRGRRRRGRSGEAREGGSEDLRRHAVRRHVLRDRLSFRARRRLR